jgi:hypothetical protein
MSMDLILFFLLLLLMLIIILLFLCSLTLLSVFILYLQDPLKRTDIVTGSVGCGTDLTQFYHPGVILSIEIRSQNTKAEDEGELNISEIYVTSFCKGGEILVIHSFIS